MVFRIAFNGNNIDGSSGNNRFDNISVTGIPIITNSDISVDEAISISLRPNPANDYFILTFEGIGFSAGILSIYKVDGTLIKEDEIVQNNSRVNINDLGKGMYVARFRSNKGIVNKRFIKN